MKNYLRKCLLVFFGAIFALLALFAASGWLALRYPSLWIHERTLKWALRHWGPKEYPITWSSVESTIRAAPGPGSRGGFWRVLGPKDFSFRFLDLCVRDKAQEAVNVCFKQASLDFSLTLEGFKPRIITAGPVDFSGGNAFVNWDLLSKMKSPPPSPSTPTKWPSWMGDAQILPINLALPQVKLITAEREVHGSLALDERILPSGERQVGLKARAALSRDFFYLEAFTQNLSGKTLSEWGASKGWGLSIQGGASLAEGAKVDLAGEASPGSLPLSRADFVLKTRYIDRKRRFSGELTGSVGAQDARLSLRGEGLGLAEGVPRVRVRQCTLTAHAPEGEPLTRFALDCPVRARIPLPPRELSQFRLPVEFGVRISGELESSTLLPGSRSRLDGNIKATLDPVLAPLFTGGGSVNVRVDGRPSEFYGGQAIQAETDLFIRVPSFERFIAELRGTAWDVPAPFRALHGDVEARVLGRSNLNEGFFPTRFDTHLESKTQALKIDATSSFEFKRSESPGSGESGSLKAKVVLKDVKLELPTLDLALPPRLMPDPRIATLKKARKEDHRDFAAKALGYEASIVTLPGHPVYLLSNLAKSPVPIGLNLNLDEKSELSGSIRVEQFPVDLFRQKAVIDHFELNLKEPRENSEIDGLVKVPHGDYTILIYLIGNISKPRVRFESDPPVPANQLISVLLYGESADDLSFTQNASVGNTQAALSQGALGLASLYLFASTPIQSVLFDPASGQVTARVSLGGGTSLNLGSNGSQLQTVGVRKQLGPAWAVTTAVDPSKVNPGSEIVTAFLEWMHRY